MNMTSPFIVSDNIERTRFYMGGYMTLLVTGKETNGEYAMIELNLRKGFEPPAHLHLNEDESMYIAQGEAVFTTEGNEPRHLKPGDFIFLPKKVPHNFKLISDTAKMICTVTPAGLEEFFMELSMPADKIDFPPAPSGPPPAAVLEKVAALQQRYGIVGMDNSGIKTI